MNRREFFRRGMRPGAAAEDAASAAAEDAAEAAPREAPNHAPSAQEREAALALARQHSASLEAPAQGGALDVVAWLSRAEQLQASPQVSAGASELLRPPGASSISAFLRDCTRCGQCLEACPHGAIALASSKMGAAQEKTPYINTTKQPCLMCDPAPCIESCPTSALMVSRRRQIGVAQIRKTSCLAWQRSFCTVCKERCPVPEAIVLMQGKPTIDPASCTGCGLCQHHCPAPLNAILITPAPHRREVHGA